MEGQPHHHVAHLELVHARLPLPDGALVGLVQVAALRAEQPPVPGSLLHVLSHELLLSHVGHVRRSDMARYLAGGVESRPDHAQHGVGPIAVPVG